MSKPIVIIGTGLGGYMLAKEWRKLDADTPLTIVTASDGRFYSKPLLSTALTKNKSADALANFSVQEMAGQLNANIHTHTHVKHIDSAAKMLIMDGKELEYEKLILACGANTINPPLEGDALDDVMSVNDLTAYGLFREKLAEKKRIAILGTGLVGCEFANDLLNAGFEINMIAPDQAPLANFVPQALGEQLQQCFAERGVRWHLGRFASAVMRDDNGYRVVMDDGSSVHADAVLSAIGLRPNLTLAKTASLRVNHGIEVDRFLQTSERDIYALGDCAEVAGQVKQYVAPLLQCARTLAKILNGEQIPVDYPVMPVVIKTPCCPVVSTPPPRDLIGEWKIEGSDGNLRALFHDEEGKLRGFALCGEAVKEKMVLAREVPLIFG